jgi:hypothetical protein
VYQWEGPVAVRRLDVNNMQPFKKTAFQWTDHVAGAISTKDGKKIVLAVQVDLKNMGLRPYSYGQLGRVVFDPNWGPLNVGNNRPPQDDAEWDHAQHMQGPVLSGNVKYLYVDNDCLKRAPEADQRAAEGLFKRVWGYALSDYADNSVLVMLRYKDNIGGIGTWSKIWNLDQSSGKLVPVPTE